MDRSVRPRPGKGRWEKLCLTLWDVHELGKYLLFGGLFLAALGALIWGLGERLSWFGHLPGDIRIEREDLRFYMPITSAILLSLFLSALFWILQKFFR